jgi:hypothetical protein
MYAAMLHTDLPRDIISEIAGWLARLYVAESISFHLRPSRVFLPRPLFSYISGSSPGDPMMVGTPKSMARFSHRGGANNERTRKLRAESCTRNVESRKATRNIKDRPRGRNKKLMCPRR